jgi:hypothetical protein
MAERTVRILVALASTDVFRRIEPFLSFSHVEVNRAPSGRASLVLMEYHRYDLIIAQYPFLDTTMADYLRVARGESSLCRTTPLFFLTREDWVAELRSQLEDEEIRIFTVETLESRFRTAIAEIVGPATRKEGKLLVRVGLPDDEGTQILQTGDISESGILLVTRNPIPVGTEITLSMDLPNDHRPIRGTAEVVRETDRGIGIRFSSLEGDGLGRWLRFVKS